MPEPKVEILFSGLILFVREEPGSHRITHVILREARNHSDSHHHDPYLCTPDDEAPIDLDRERLELVWLDGSCKELDVDGAGARPDGDPDDAVDLPRLGEEERFYWTPHLRQLQVENPVKSKALGVEDVPLTVVANVLLGAGRIFTADFAFAHDPKKVTVNAGLTSGDEEDLPVVVPMMSFLPPTGGSRRDQACSEKVIWRPQVPEGAEKVIVRSTSFFSKGGNAEPVDRRSFGLTSGQPVRLTISNNQPPSNYKRPPGTVASHFEMLYGLLEGGDAIEPVIPRVPDPYRPLPASSGSWPPRNVISYSQRAKEFADCHLPVVGTKDRPICVPAVADWPGET
jgi:hypothetical protein